MRYGKAAGGWTLVAAMLVGLVGQTALAAPRSSASQKASSGRTAAKKSAGSPSPKVKKSAANRPDPNDLPNVEEPAPKVAAPNEPTAAKEAAAPTVKTPASQPVEAPPAEPMGESVASPPAGDSAGDRLAEPAEEEAPGEPEEIGESPGAPVASGKEIGVGKAMVLGVVEGLTEYLPVSSTGHLILVSYWLGLAEDTGQPGVFGGRKIESSQAVDAFEIVIQLGAILAVLGLYRKRVGQMMRGLAGRNPNGLRLAMLLLVAFLPAAVIGLALHKAIQAHLFGPMPVVIALAVGGVLMIVVEHFFWTRPKSRLHAAIQTRALTPVGAARADSTGPMVNVRTVTPGASRFTKVDTMTFPQALAIGLAQCLSLWPGTSRSMVTILAALVVGLDMAAAAEFSFLLALPTLGAATLYSGMKHWDELMQATGVGGLLVGLIVSGVVAAVAVKWFVGFLTRHGLLPFGVYRIVAALFLMLYFLR